MKTSFPRIGSIVLVWITLIAPVRARADEAGKADAVKASDVSSSDKVVARVNGAPITMQQLTGPLIEGYGLNMLVTIVQLEMAKQAASKTNITITPDDIKRERDQTIERMFQDSNAKLQDKIDKAVDRGDTAETDRLKQELKNDNEKGFRLFLENQKKSEAEFNLVIETNTYLRKMAEPMLAGKITEDNLKEAFATLYGETVEVRHIQCSTLQEVQEAKRRLSDGDSFEKVARDLSRNENTRINGGRIPPFSREFVGFPQAFRDAAFALQPGQVSEIVQADNSYHLIMLEKRNQPKVVKFEDVKDSIRKELYDRATQVTITQLRQQMQADALKVMQIEEPTLKKQLEDRLKRNAEIMDQQEIRRQMDKERLNQPAPPGGAAPSPAPAPTTAP